jgi:site-specific DNA-cytosine methylase
MLQDGQPIAPNPVLTDPAGLARSEVKLDFNKGLSVLSLFSGMDTELEALLLNGHVVRKYTAVESSAASRRVSHHRLQQLHDRFPTQLPLNAIQETHSALPHDVSLVTGDHLDSLGTIDLVFAGWPCQGHSRAGRGRGFQDPRSQHFYDMLRIIKATQNLNMGHVGYIIENVYPGRDRRSQVASSWEKTLELLGEPVIFDAAQLGSRAHRVRAYWTNLAPVSYLKAAVGQQQRPPNLTVQQILEPNRVPTPVTSSSRFPQYPCNSVGKPREALPTLVSYPRSYAFTGGQPGLIYDKTSQKWTVPLAVERERAMGFQTGSTEAPDTTEETRCRILGQAQDLNSMRWLVGISLSYTPLSDSAQTSEYLQFPSIVMNQISQGIAEGGKVSKFHTFEDTNFRGIVGIGGRARLPSGGAEREVDFEKDIGLRNLQSGGARHGTDTPIHVHPKYLFTVPNMSSIGSNVRPPEVFAAVDPSVNEWQLGKQLTAEEKQKLSELLYRNRDCFSWSNADLGKYKGTNFRIDLIDESQTVWAKQYPLSKTEKEVIEKKVKDLVDSGLVRESEGLHGFASPTVLPPKKDSEGKTVDWRMCGDYRELNAATISDKYPMPTPEEIFDALAGATLFSTLDLRQGFHQIKIEPSHRCRTAFWAGSKLYEWLYMPFGLKNAPAKFQRCMDEALRGVNCARCYIDDVIIFSRSFEEHLEHIQLVFNALRKAGLTCHPGKCLFGVDFVMYLGHEVRPGTLGPQIAKVAALDALPIPKNISDLRTFLGLASYYRKFIPGFSTIAQPLNSLLRKEQAWVWEEDQEKGFQELKAILKTQPVLRMPDHSKPFILYTDWSAAGLGAVLAQIDDGGFEYVIAYASRSNNRAEGNYSSYHGELLAAVWAITHFRYYLYGKKFQLITDHQPLKWIMTNSKLTGKLARWALILQEYEFEIIHRPGESNGNADGLSRNPDPSTKDQTGARKDEDPDAFCAFACPSYFLALQAPLSSFTVDVRDVEGQAALGGGRTDIWLDAHTLQALREGEVAENLPATERNRVQQRMQCYALDRNVLLRVFSNGERRVVPQPTDRETLVVNLHETCGHFGQKRTYSLVAAGYWWHGMRTQVNRVVQMCTTCDRVKAHFDKASSPQLQSLPIMGMFYRWSLDLAGPLPLSRKGNQYVLVMIEHFSKWIELVVLPTKLSKYTAEAFLQRVLAQFGAPAEVLTDQGTEFQGEFSALLDKCLIDHRLTSRDHPQADGLAERCVQTVKRALRKYALEEDVHNWDRRVPWIAMGYRFSRQAALHSLSPYFLLFGRHPILPGVAAAQSPVLPLMDDRYTLEHMILQRAKVFQNTVPIAMGNLRAAQHRDQIWYSQRRTGDYIPRRQRFQVGDKVYRTRQVKNTLDSATDRGIFKVVKISSQGVLTLQGLDGRKLKDNVINVAPCAVPELENDPFIHATFVVKQPECHFGVECLDPEGVSDTLVCFACALTCHDRCRPLTWSSKTSAPVWYCGICLVDLPG